MSECGSGPFFGVAIPTCNGQPHIASALGSVLAQAKDLPFELIISDDCSDDTTLDEVRSRVDGDAIIHQNPTRLGLAGNWNQCLALARTLYVTIFHQDDVMLPGHLMAHARAFARDSGIGLVASGSTVIDAEGKPVAPEVVPASGLGPADLILPPGEFAPLMLCGNPLRCSAISLRVAAAQQVGLFDSSYRYVLDADYWVRISRQWKIAWLAEPTVLVRWHPKSETHRFKTGTADLDENERLMNELFAKDLADHPHRADLRRLGARTLARAFVNRAHDALRGRQPELAHEALTRALRLSPGIVTTLIKDPRLALQMMTLAMSPSLANRWFGR